MTFRPALVAICLACSGCAFLFKGAKQDVAFSSNPDGADVENNGSLLGKTDSTVGVPRSGTVNIRVSKDGYQERYVHLDRSADVPWFFWDTATCVVPVLLCIPVLTDAISGAWWNYDDEYTVNLHREPAATAPAKTEE